MDQSTPLHRPKQSGKINFGKVCLLAVLAPLFLATHAVGAVISWQTPSNVDINNPNQVLNNGTFVAAGSIYVEFGGAPAQTINGVTFGSFENSHLAITPSAGGFYGWNDTPYQTILAGDFRMNNSSSPTSPVILSGLTAGQTYQFQVWVGYLWGNYATRFSSSAPDGATNSTAPNESATLNVSTTSGGLTQYVVGTFLADATTQNFYYYGNGGDSVGIGTISAYSLRAVPEPQTWALAGLGLCAVFFRLRRKQRAS